MARILKHLKAYVVGGKIELKDIQALAQSRPLAETTATKPETIGFEPPFRYLDQSGDPKWIESYEGYHFGIITIESRKPKSAEISNALRKRLKELESAATAEGEEKPTFTRAFMAEERKKIKEELRGKTPPDRKQVYFVFRLELGELWLNTSVASEYDKVADFFSSNQIPLQPKPLSMEIEESLTRILDDPINTLTEDFDLGSSAHLSESESNAAANYSNQDLGSEELKRNLAKDKFVKKLQLVFKDTLTFSVNSGHCLSNIRYKDSEAQELTEFDSQEGAEMAYHERLIISIGLELIVAERLLREVYKLMTNIDTGSDDISISSDEISYTDN